MLFEYRPLRYPYFSMAERFQITYCQFPDFFDVQTIVENRALLKLARSIYDLFRLPSFPLPNSLCLTFSNSVLLVTEHFWLQFCRFPNFFAYRTVDCRANSKRKLIIANHIFLIIVKSWREELWGQLEETPLTFNRQKTTWISLELKRDIESVKFNLKGVKLWPVKHTIPTV